MSGKRVLALYGALLFCFAAVVCRLYWLCSDTDYGARAAAQSVVTLHLPARRGNFYDHRGQLLTGQTTRWMALCVPGEGSYARLFAYTDAAGQAALYQKRNAASPFLLEVDRDVSALGVSCWPAARRSSAAPLAVQLLGYLDGEGHGAAGLEAAFDELLTGSGAGDTLLCIVNAQGKLRAEPVLTPADSGAVGVQLTLSREIQQTAEAVANETMQSGCILVLDTAAALQALLAGVVAGGTGHEAALPGQTAAGKTGTAQTGQFSGGTELKNYWFAGFVPAEQPRYTIVVLQDTQAEPAFSSAAIFARVAAGLEILAP